MRQALPEDPPALAETVPIAEASERAASLTSRLLAYSKHQVLQPRRLSPSRRIAESEALLRRLCGPAIELTILAPESAALVPMDAIQFDQVVLNLVANARDASPTGGRIRVSVDERALFGPGSQTESEPAPGDYVLLSVRDEGEGMSDEARKHVFVPLFTTKTTGGGGGLGLAACRTIVTSAGGRILVGSCSQSGTEMLVYLPRVGAEEVDGGDGGTPPAAGGGLEQAGSRAKAGTVTTRSDSSASATPRAGRQKLEVLLVEDEPDIRSLLARVLVQHGHAVATAASADEALALLESAEGQFDRLVTDVLLPGTSGLELGRRLLAEDERLRVVYISGFPAASLDELGQLGPRERFVSKPFTPQQVLAALED